MSDTHEFIKKTDSMRFAKDNEDGAYNSQWDFTTMEAAGSIRSTAADLITYAKAQLGNVPAELKKDIELTHIVSFSDDKGKVGLSWFYVKPGKDEVLFHNGETGGYHSYMAINIQKKFAVVILSNCARSIDDAGNAIMKWLEENE